MGHPVRRTIYISVKNESSEAISGVIYTASFLPLTTPGDTAMASPTKEDEIPSLPSLSPR